MFASPPVPRLVNPIRLANLAALAVVPGLGPFDGANHETAVEDAPTERFPRLTEARAWIRRRSRIHWQLTNSSADPRGLWHWLSRQETLSTQCSTNTSLSSTQASAP